MLSTPPAFNLSQNQTLQLIETTSLLIFLRAKLKVHVPNSLFTCQRTRGICPCRQGVSLSGEAGTYSRRFGLSTTFFRSPKVFFRSAPPFGFPSGGAEAGIYSASLSLSTVFSTRPDFFQTRRPTLQPPRGNLKRLSILPHPEQTVNNLFSESKKNNRLVTQQSPAETRTLATGTSVPQRRRRFMHLCSPPVNSFFCNFLLYFSLYNKTIMLYFQCSERRTLRPSPDPSR